MAEKLQQDAGMAFRPELVSLLDNLERELRTDQVSEQSRQWLMQCGLTAEQMKSQLEAEHTPERKLHLYHCDHRGLPLALIDEGGAIAWRAEYDEWGNLLSEDNPQALQQLIRLPGQQADEESGLYYNRHRYYDPQQGRYITQDPIGLRGGWTAYVYPLNPVQYRDPKGLSSQINLGTGFEGYGRNISSLDILMTQNGASPYEVAQANHNMCIGANGWNPGNTYAKGIVFGASAIGIGGLGGGSFNGVLTCQQYTKCIVN